MDPGTTQDAPRRDRPGITPAETAALRRALEIAADPAVPFGPNPMPRWQAGLGLLAWSGIPVLLGWLSFTRRDS